MPLKIPHAQEFHSVFDIFGCGFCRVGPARWGNQGILVCSRVSGHMCRSARWAILCSLGSPGALPRRGYPERPCPFFGQLGSGKPRGVGPPSNVGLARLLADHLGTPHSATPHGRVVSTRSNLRITIGCSSSDKVSGKARRTDSAGFIFVTSLTPPDLCCSDQADRRARHPRGIVGASVGQAGSIRGTP